MIPVLKQTVNLFFYQYLYTYLTFRVCMYLTSILFCYDQVQENLESQLL